MRCSNVIEGDVDLQIKLSKSHSESSSKKKLQLWISLGLAIDRVSKRIDNDEVCALANVPTTKNQHNYFF